MSTRALAPTTRAITTAHAITEQMLPIPTRITTPTMMDPITTTTQTAALTTTMAKGRLLTLLRAEARSKVVI